MYCTYIYQYPLLPLAICNPKPKGLESLLFVFQLHIPIPANGHFPLCSFAPGDCSQTNENPSPNDYTPSRRNEDFVRCTWLNFNWLWSLHVAIPFGPFPHGDPHFTTSRRASPPSCFPLTSSSPLARRGSGPLFEAVLGWYPAGGTAKPYCAEDIWKIKQIGSIISCGCSLKKESSMSCDDLP